MQDFRRANIQYSTLNMSIFKEMFNLNVNWQRQFSSQLTISIFVADFTLEN